MISGSHDNDGNGDDLRGVFNPDFVALGLGVTSMMAMLWTVAMGRRTVGVEMRGDPAPGQSWNLAAETYHQLGLIDQLMMERYGADRLPRRGDGSVFRLAECLYTPGTTTGNVAAEEIIECFEEGMRIAGTIDHLEFVDDRWRDGAPQRVVTVTPPAERPGAPNPDAVRGDVEEVLRDTFQLQVSAAELLTLLRRYLEAIEEMDLSRSDTLPRVRLFNHHRVVDAPDDGFVGGLFDCKRIRIEEVHELDYRGVFVHVRKPGTTVIDLGIPELFMVTQGADSSDAQRLGFKQQDFEVDHQDGRGPVPARADFVASLLSMFVMGRIRKRIASEFDENDNEYWVRQFALGHENDPEVGWVLVQVPDFQTFDPVSEGLVPADTDPATPEYYAMYQHLLTEFFFDQAELLLEVPRKKLLRMNTFYGPKLVSVTARMGADARVAANGVVAGSTFGSGHFFNSGDSVAGFVGHSSRVRDYWQARDAGKGTDAAIRELADSIKADTEAWLRVSIEDFSAPPSHANFTAEGFEKIEAAGRNRRYLASLDLSDWNRLLVRAGRIITDPLRPPCQAHPAECGGEHQPQEGHAAQQEVEQPQEGHAAQEAGGQRQVGRVARQEVEQRQEGHAVQQAGGQPQEGHAPRQEQDRHPSNVG